ncbi:MAG: DNA phosphorothioation system restriction enzyme [Geminocystis sp.]|nr:DNA phosphorothioation system restriction enzyme [Geminocystis sp.]HIK36686.1 DNA phosphorothioation system restriction enzyme [Geminocystis sp. M7585_C2015_104]MCS7146764.1 DNA phosphorothioation system restriction enzyme [Geminocystis sp.]MCX8077086.1 DNA phosphorothioation system restriction enzyme [Geminocystis sp.]MDW8115590.1 DNA phosphorothioation system restriction enzyme [Geminocystis sp.]
MPTQGFLSFPLFHPSQIDWDNLVTQINRGNRLALAEKRSRYSPSSSSGFPQFPPDLVLRDYQREAIINWFKNHGRGTLKMATGSGKTITALAIATELYQRIGLKILLIICPFRHLVTQWEKEAKRFNLLPILAFENASDWQNILTQQLYLLNHNLQEFLTVIVTNSTFITDRFQSLIPYFHPKTLIVGDEAHNLGTPRFLSVLPSSIGLRLALSATPERHFDDGGTELLIDYFGKVLQPEFTIGEAIKKGALVEYNYYPIMVELTYEEAIKYARITQKIGWAISDGEDIEYSPRLRSLLLQRARLVAVAENKLIALRNLMRERREMKPTLFYCGDGNVSQNTRQLEAVTQILGKELNYKVNTYTAETPTEERERIKRQLVDGELDGIVAIRCLDEGVDIPMIANAVILASSTNPRQFIQRRGRILRPYPGKKEANIFDMIVLPPLMERDAWAVERSLLKRELARLVEFARLAKNSDSAYNLLGKIYNLIEGED